jgi:radical SAM protein with 4Fe4S-binding SPASM domain
MRQLGHSLLSCNLYFQGEPLLHPEFPSFLHQARKVYKTISTNGHFLTETIAKEIVKSGRGKIIISMDGLDQETYSLYRTNGDLERVMEGLNNISQARKKYKSVFNIEVQMLVNRFNEHQVEEFRKFARELGVKPVLKTMQIYDTEAYSRWLPESERFRRYSEVAGEYRIKSDLPNRCSRLWFVPVITWDGRVLPCCFDKDATYVMGDLGSSTFRDIWKGEKYRKFRRAVLSERNKFDICRNCTSGIRLIKK